MNPTNLPSIGHKAVNIIRDNLRYGVYDRIDKVWMGDKRGPMTFTEQGTGIAAAVLISERMQQSRRYVCKRILATEYHHRDEVTPPLSFVEALNNLGKVSCGKCDPDDHQQHNGKHQK